MAETTTRQQNQRYRNWMWTCFSPDDFRFKEPLSPITYSIYQLEVCPDTQRQHLQGYLELSKPQTLKNMRDMFAPLKIHWEPRRGTQQDAIAYCSKSDTRIDGPYQLGTPKKQGARNDLKDLFEMVKENKSNLDILEEMPGHFMRYNRGIEKARFEVRKATSKTQRDVEVSLYYGDPGTGKTKQAYELYPDLFCLSGSSNTGVWFDGYEGESTLLLDDFYGWIKWGFLMQLLDRYPLRLDIKGGHSWANWTRVIITTNSSYTTWYANEDTRKDLRSLERRIHNIWVFVKGMAPRKDK